MKVHSSVDPVNPTQRVRVQSGLAEAGLHYDSVTGHVMITRFIFIFF